MMYIGLYFLFLIFNFRRPLVYQFYYCYMLPSLNKVLLTYLLTYLLTNILHQKCPSLGPCDYSQMSSHMVQHLHEHGKT